MGQAYNSGKLCVLSCTSGKHFAEKVVKTLDDIMRKEDDYSECVMTESVEPIFADTELKTEINESIRKQDVYIFQDVANHSKGMSVNDNFMALKSAIDAAKRSGALSITAVMPTFPYARQDKAKSREGISAAMVAREVEDVGADKVITLDVHNNAIAGFFRFANLENLRASRELIEYVKENYNVCDFVVVAADAGGAARANYFAKTLGTKLAFMYKERDYSQTNFVEKTSLLGNVKDKDVLVVEDIIDTAGTLENSSLVLKAEGAKKVFLAASLAMLNGPAIKRLDKLYSEGILGKVIGTNVIYKPDNFSINHPWYDDVKLEKYFARVIYNLNKGISISKLLD